MRTFEFSYEVEKQSGGREDFFLHSRTFHSAYLSHGGLFMLMFAQFIFPLVFLTIASCATTQQATNVGTAGFLDDYSILQKGSEDHEALLRYVNPNADWKNYYKVMIDPVQLWVGQGSSLRDLPRDERIQLTSLLFGEIRNAALAHYQIVREPGPHVIRISVALTEATTSKTVLDTISSVLPTGYLFSGTKSLATGTGTFMGAASVEAKITDAELGTLLAAVIDRRGGAKRLPGSTAKWSDVENSFQYWASVLRYRLCQWRGERSCAEPKA